MGGSVRRQSNCMARLKGRSRTKQELPHRDYDQVSTYVHLVKSVERFYRTVGPQCYSFVGGLGHTNSIGG